MLERRKFARFSISGTINIKSKGGLRCEAQAALENISFGGLCLIAKEALEPNSSIELELISHSLNQPLIIKGIVRHTTDSFSTGIEFVDVNQDTILYLVKRQQLKSAEDSRNKRKSRHLDFIPY